MNPLQTSLILPPALTVYDRTSVIAFVKEWNIYLSRVKRYNDAAGNDRTLTTVPLRECMDRSIVYTIITFDLDLDSAITEDSVDDKILLDYLNSFIGASSISAVECIRSFQVTTVQPL